MTNRLEAESLSWFGASSTIRLLALVSAFCLAVAAPQQAQTRSLPGSPAQPRQADSRLIEGATQEPNTTPTRSSYQLPAARAVIQTLPVGIVSRIELHGTAMGTAPYVVALIEQKPGTAIDREAIRRSIRRLYQTQLFETIDVVWEPVQPQASSGVVGPEAGQIKLIFETTPRYFCGTLSIDGLPKDGPKATEMINSATLELGTRYSPEHISQTLERMHRPLQENRDIRPSSRTASLRFRCCNR